MRSRLLSSGSDHGLVDHLRSIHLYDVDERQLYAAEAKFRTLAHPRVGIRTNLARFESAAERLSSGDRPTVVLISGNTATNYHGLDEVVALLRPWRRPGVRVALGLNRHREGLPGLARDFATHPDSLAFYTNGITRLGRAFDLPDAANSFELRFIEDPAEHAVRVRVHARVPVELEPGLILHPNRGLEVAVSRTLPLNAVDDLLTEAGFPRRSVHARDGYTLAIAEA